MTDERLIEEAAKAIQDIARERVPGIVIGERAAQTTHEYARAALAVFEKAHTPTNDERIDQAIAYIRAAWLGTGEPTRNTPAGEIIAILRGDRGFEVPEPQGDDHSDHARCSECAEWPRKESQGEPSDERIRLATLAAVKKGAKSDAEAMRNYREAERVIRAAIPHLRHHVPQGEPSDAQVDAAARSIYETREASAWGKASGERREFYRRNTRAALRAAWGVR